MGIRDDEWFEVWYAGADVVPAYMLLVTSDQKHIGEIRVIDPFKNNLTVYKGKTYESVCNWLWEDDFHLADGRQFPDDGW